MNIVGQNGNDGIHYDLEPTEQAVADYVDSKDEDWKVVHEPEGDFKDFEKNYAKYMIIDKNGNRTFLEEKPVFKANPSTIEVTLSDGRKGKINRNDDSRIIYM